MTYQAVLLDFDGVVADSFKYHVPAWQHVLGPMGISVAPQTVYRNEGQPVAVMLRTILTAAGRELPDETQREIVARKNAHFQKHNRAQILPGVVQFLQFLHERGLKSGLVTGTLWANLHAVLRPEQLALFDVVITDGDTPRGKPHPDPYLAAAAKLQLAPEECLVIENAPMGIAAAKAAGMTCFALTTSLAPEHLQQADRILPDIAAVRSFISAR